MNHHRHPSTWYVSTLIRRYGPRDQREYLVLSTLDGISGPKRRPVVRSLDQLAEETRMTPKGARGVLRRLEDTGLVTVHRPATYYRGQATTYLINPEPMIRAACEAEGFPVDHEPERVTGGYPYPDEEGSPPVTHNGPEGSPGVPERVTGGYPSLSIQSKDIQSSSAPPPATEPTPVVTRAADDDANPPEDTPNDDPVLATLDGLPGRPYPAPDVARLIDQCLTAGWTVDALRAELDGALAGTGIRSHMAVTRAALKSLADTAPPPAATPEAEWPEWCGRCGGPEHAQRWVTLANGAARCRRCNPYAPGYGTPEPIQRPLTTYAVPAADDDDGDPDAVVHALASYFRMPPSRTGTDR